MKHLRQYIRQMLVEAAGVSGAPYFSPPQVFKDETGIDLVHRYKLPTGFSSGKALQDWADANEPKDPAPVDINDFYAPLVDELIKLNPELAPLRGVGKVEEWDLLPDQEMSEVYPWHLKDIVVGVASEFPLADLLYYFDGSSDTSWDIGTQIEKKIGVRPQWMLSPETAKKHFNLQEHRIRGHIRNILTETWDPGNWRRGKQVYFNMGEATKAIKDIIAKTESYASGADTEGAREFGKMMADLFISQLEEIEVEERNMWLWFANKHMGFAKEKHRQWKPEYEALHALMGAIFHPELMD